MRKIRTGITEKEYHLKCCGLYHSEGVKGRGSEIIPKLIFQCLCLPDPGKEGKAALQPSMAFVQNW